MKQPATMVTIDDFKTYRLGMFFPHRKQVQCIGLHDSLVHRVCHFEEHFRVGTKCYTSGEHLHFHEHNDQ